MNTTEASNGTGLKLDQEEVKIGAEADYMADVI